MHKNTNLTLRTPWLAAVATSVGLVLAAGCIDDQVAPAEPSADDAKAIIVPAGPSTTASLGIESWRYMPTNDGIVVRGLAFDAVPRARFWISAGDTPDELIAHSTDNGAQVSIPREGVMRGADDGLRDAVTAFRADVEAVQGRDKDGGSQQVNDYVLFCPGSTGVFATWAFWRPTYIQIENPSSYQWMKFSFQAGAGYEENWVQPAAWSQYARNYWGVAVKIQYLESYPPGVPGPCPVHVNVL